MNKKLPLFVLLLSIIFLISALITLGIGSNKSRIYNQMKDAIRVTSIKEINRLKDESFLLSGYIEKDHTKQLKDLVAYIKKSDRKLLKLVNPALEIKLEDGSINLIGGYGIADYNKIYNDKKTIINGIKSGVDITIYSIKYKNISENSIKGYELYPGTADQYINFLSSPFNSYMMYVRILIALALIFFIFSIVINIRK